MQDLDHRGHGAQSGVNSGTALFVRTICVVRNIDVQLIAHHLDHLVDGPRALAVILR